jgi:hypothetical protein
VENKNFKADFDSGWWNKNRGKGNGGSTLRIKRWEPLWSFVTEINQIDGCDKGVMAVFTNIYVKKKPTSPLMNFYTTRLRQRKKLVQHHSWTFHWPLHLGLPSTSAGFIKYPSFQVLYVVLFVGDCAQKTKNFLAML